MAKIVLDLHEIYNKGFAIDAELSQVITEALQKKITLVEIIPGKGSGQLKKRVWILGIALNMLRGGGPK